MQSQINQCNQTPTADMDTDEWRQRQFDQLSRVVDFILTEPTPELVRSIYERCLWVNESVCEVTKDFHTSSYSRAEALVDALGLISEAFAAKGLDLDPNHAALAPLLPLFQNLDYNLVYEFRDNWTRIDWDAVEPSIRLHCNDHDKIA